MQHKQIVHIFTPHMEGKKMILHRAERKRILKGDQNEIIDYTFTLAFEIKKIHHLK